MVLSDETGNIFRDSQVERHKNRKFKSLLSLQNSLVKAMLILGSSLKGKKWKGDLSPD